MPSWSLFFNYYYYLIKSSILNFVLVRKEKEEGRRVCHRIFPWQTGDSPRASHRARWHTVPAGQALGLRSVFERPELSVELGRRGVSSPALSRPLPPDPGPGPGRDPRRRRRLRLRARPGGRPRPGTSPPPAPGLQSAVPAAELADEQKPLCGGQPGATIGLCAAPAPGLPRGAEGAHGRRPPGTVPPLPPRAGSGGAAGGSGRPAPSSACRRGRPRQVRNVLPSGGAGRALQRRFEEGRVPRLLPRAGAGVPRSGPHPAGQAPRDPPGPGPLASRSPPVGCQPPPAAASRSSPPGPSAPFIFPRLRLGFCWFLGDKNRLK